MQTRLLSFGKFYFSSYLGLPSACWQGVSLSFIESILSGVFYFFTIYFVKDLHLDVATAASIISFFGIGAMFGGYIGGRLSDKFSPVVVASISLLAQAIGYLALIKIHSVFSLMCVVSVLGIAAYSFITSIHLWTLNQCGSSEAIKIKVINLLSAGANLGFGISGLVIGVCAQYGFHLIFFVIGILLLVLAMYTIFFIRNDKRNDVDKLINRAHEFEATINPNVMTSYVLPAIFFIGAIVSQLSSVYPIYIQSSFPTLGLNGVSILFAINSMMVVLLSTLIGSYISNYNKLFMMSVGGCVIGLGMCMLVLTSNFIFAIISCVIYTIGEIIFFCMAQLLCYQNSSQETKGRGLGLFRVTFASSRMFGPIVGGYIYHYSNPNVIWYLSGVLGLLCLVGYEQVKKYNSNSVCGVKASQLP